MKIKWCALVPLVVILLLSAAACGGGPKLDYTGSDLRINTTSLPAWIEGTYGSFALNATGGTGKLSWRGTPPEPWLTLDPSGVISGTAPLLPYGTAMRITAPFTVTVIDEARHAREATYAITILPKKPQITPKNITAIWDENAPPAGDILRLDAVISNGYPPYRMGIPGSFGLPLGMKVEIDPDGIHIILRGPPPKAKFAEETREFQIYIVDSNNIEALADVTLVVKKAAQEVFEGDFSGVLGTASGSTGCQWSWDFSSTMTLTLTQNSDGTISGTANVPTDIIIKAIYSPPGGTCRTAPYQTTATGTVSGTNQSLTGSFIGPSDILPEHPLTMAFSGVRSGDKITGSIVINFTAWISLNNIIESTPSFSTTVPIVLTKK